jgi:ribonuclease E
MLIDAAQPEETRVVVLGPNGLEEFDFESSSLRTLKGNIYLAKVTRVEPSLQAAFVSYGGNRHGFLPFNEIHPDYYRIPIADREAIAEAAAAERAERVEDDEDEDTEDDVIEAEVVDVTEDSAADSDDTSDDDAEEVEASDDGDAAEKSTEAADDSALEDDAVIAKAETAEDDGDSTNTEAGDDGEEGENGDGRSIAMSAENTEDKIEKPHDAAEAAEADATEGSSDEQPVEAAKEPTAEAAPAAEAPAADDNGATEAGADPEADAIAETEDASGGARASDKESTDAEPAARTPRRRRNTRKSQPRRHYKIQEVVKRGQVMLVQVSKEERGGKGAAMTTYISLAGRYCVLMPNTGKGGGVSRKITDVKDRKRLKGIIDDLELPQGMATIVRTAGTSRTKAEIKRDHEFLLRLWDEIRERTLTSTAPALIYEEASLVKRAIRDLYTRDIESVSVQGDGAYREAKDFMRSLMPSHAKRVQPYKEATPLFQKHGVEGRLETLFDPIVRLPSGGYLVINQTEALVAVDVNSGRSTRERNIEETAVNTNKEAAVEVARQLRLRELAGIVVIDFIDMDERRNNAAVERKLKDALKVDRARVHVGRMSPLGLMEISRQRLRPSMFETSFHECPSCSGLGRVRSLESNALGVLRAAEDAANATGNGADIAVTAATDCIMYILNNKRDIVARIEESYGVRILFNQDDKMAPHERKAEIIRQGEGGGTPAAASEAKSARQEEPEAREGGRDEGRGRGRGRNNRGGDKNDRGEKEGRGGRNRNRSAGDTEEAAAEAALAPNGTNDADEDGGNRRRRGRRGGRRRGRNDENGEADLNVDAATTETEGEAANTQPKADGEESGGRKRRRRGRGRGRNRKSNDGENQTPGEAAEGSTDANAEAAEVTDEGTQPEAEAVVGRQADAPVEAALETALEPAETVAEPAPETVVEAEPEPLAEAGPEPAPEPEKPAGPPKSGWWRRLSS